ncbi:substrate-binding domain-containing protein [Streptomyces sp. NPDC056716]|uniref:sugar ABC transporter substrate-binding protein n=1 Tax=unclassified Streptomyces TaxID=2593676 RepID=UPI0036B52743
MRSRRHQAGLLVATAGLTALAACSPASSNSDAGGGDATGTYAYTSGDESITGTDVTTLEEPLFAGLTKPDKELRFGVVLKTLTNEYWQEVERGMEAAAQKYGIDLTVQASSGESSQSQQLSIAQTMSGQDFDAFLVSPESTSNLTPAIKQMQAKDVPIVNVEDARIDATTFLGPASLVEGGKAGEYIAAQLPDGGKVAQIEGSAGSNAAELRTRGFKEAVTKAGNLDLVASVPGDWDASKAYNEASSLLKANPDLAAIYANNDTMALGVVKAVADVGRTGDVIVVGTDGVPSAVKAIRGGTLSATTTPLPYSQGYWAVQSALALVQGKEVPVFVLTSAVLVDKENVAEMYAVDGRQSTDPR